MTMIHDLQSMINKFVTYSISSVGVGVGWRVASNAFIENLCIY